MQIEVPFLYRAVVVRARRRTEETVTLIGHQPLEIGEFAPSEAPVVARFRPREGEEFGFAWRPTDYRMVGGGLAKPYRSELHPGPAMVANLQAHFDAWIRHCLSVGRPEGHVVLRRFATDWLSPKPMHFQGPISDERGFEVRRWVSDSRAAAIDRLTRAASTDGGLAFVGGELHVPSLGPCWVIRDDHRREGNHYQNYVSVDAAPELASVGDSEMVRSYAAARHATAVAAAASRAQAKGWPLRNPGKGDLSARAGAFRQRDDDLALLGVANNMAAAMEPIVGKLPTSAIRLYADFRDTIRAVADPGADVTAALLPIVRAVDAAWARHCGVGRVEGFQNELLAYDLRDGRDPEAVDLPEIGLDDLRDLGLAPPRPGGR